jgi:hypothetical protein
MGGRLGQREAADAKSLVDLASLAARVKPCLTKNESCHTDS